MQEYIRHKKKGVYYCKDLNCFADNNSINFLYKESIKIKKNIVRLCLHENEKSELMSMLILVRDFYIYPAHRHAWKDECYTVIKGEMEFQELDERGKLLFKKRFSSGETFLNKSRGFHKIIPKEHLLCFIETTNGPFVDRKMDFI